MDVPLELLLLFCVGALAALVSLFLVRQAAHRIRATVTQRQRRSNWLQLIVWAAVCYAGCNIANIAAYLHHELPEENAMAIGIFFPAVLLLLATTSRAYFDRDRQIFDD